MTGRPGRRRAGPGIPVETHADFEIAGSRLAPGERATLALQLPGLSAFTPLAMPLHVVHGMKPGPVLFVSAAIHGDEINGVEIIRRLRHLPALSRLSGTLVCIPVVNMYGFLNHTRYLPDRRDLNRSFPGSARGSLAARIADIFSREIVGRASHGIDLHTGGNHRTNLPHIRVSLDDPEASRLARSFGAPVIVNADLRDGSLRQHALDRGLTMLLYEAGEALRFDEQAIAIGMQGTVNVMAALGMLPPRPAWALRNRAMRNRATRNTAPEVALSSHWIRAPQSGLLRTGLALGQRVAQGETLGHLADVAGENDRPLAAPIDGIVIGRCNLPAVHEGDALFHIASFAKAAPAPAAPDGASHIPDDASHIEGLRSADYPGQPGR